MPDLTPDELDYGSDAPKRKSPEEVFPALNELVRQGLSFAAQVASLEKMLAEKRDAERSIFEQELPQMMKECGVESFTTTDGLIITRRDKVVNSIPEANRNEAYDWLEKNNLGDIIKRNVTVSFAVTESDEAKACAAKLSAEYNRGVNMDRKVESSTLKSVITKRIDTPQALPEALFGVRKFEIADVKIPKKKD